MDAKEIKDRYSMRDILARYRLPEPNRAGYISCPFHRENTASMKIYKDGYNCYGCGANGDIFTFVMETDNLTFTEAFRLLGGEYEQTYEAKMRAYRAAKRREMERKAEMVMERKRSLNKALIGVYMRWLNRSEPLSDSWCDSYNLLQKELYKSEILNE